MRSRELFLREKVSREGISKSCEFSKYEEQKDTLFECSVCKYDCYLSAIVCPCSPKNIVCLRHSDKYCDCSVSRKYLLFKYRMSEIEEMCRNVGATDRDLEESLFFLEEKKIETEKGRGMKGVSLKKRFSRLIGVTKPVVRKLARKAGMSRIESMNYFESNKENEEISIIKTILQSRINHGKQEYLVKWESDESSWEKASEMCCPSLVEAFKNNFKEKKTQEKPTQLRRSRRMGRGSHV